MSFARSLSDYLTKCKTNNWLIRPTQLSYQQLPSAIIQNIYPAQLPTSRRTKQNDSQLLLENYHLVGKDSHFERQNVQQYIKPLGLRSLKRAKSVSEEDYPEEQARHLSHLARVDTDTLESAIHDQSNEPILRKILETLVDITPKPETEFSPSLITLNSKSKRMVKLPKREVYGDIPALPDFEKDPHEFEQYVHTLTHATFHFKNSSKFNGVIPKILKNLFHPLNSNTAKLRTLEAYNDMLHFYGLKWNLASARELLVQMKLEGVTANVTTYNIMLKNLLIVQNIQHMSNPYIVALKLLTQMKSKGVQADVATWNLLFKLIREDLGKAALLSNRNLLNIPLDNHSVNCILKYLAIDKKLDSHSLLQLIHSYDFTIDRGLLILIVRKLVDEGHYDAVFKILDFVKDNYNVSPAVMNLLLIPFANKGKLDITLAIVNTFQTKYDVKPDFKSYNLLMKCLAQSGNWNQKYRVWRVIYGEMLEDLQGIVAGEYWIRKLRAFFKFHRSLDVNLSLPLTEPELELKQLKSQLNVDQSMRTSSGSSNLQSYRAVAKKFGYHASRNQTVNDPELKDRQRAQKKKYMKKISTLGIQKAMVARIPYAKDPYEALKTELTDRGIISK